MTGGVGFWLGVAIGLLSAIVSQLNLLDVFKPRLNGGWWSRTFSSDPDFAKTAVKLVALPALWFGGAVLASAVGLIDWKTQMPSYGAGAAMAYCALFGLMYLRLAIRTWNAIGASPTSASA